MTSFVRDKLAEAKHALGAGETEAAVNALVAAWAKLPSTRVGAIAISLSRTLPHEPAPAKVADRERVWLTLAATPKPEVVPTLVAFDWPVFPRAMKQRMDRLATFPPDPRIAASLRDLWHSGAYRSQQGGVFWRRAFRMLLNWKDPGTAAILALAKRDDEYGILESVIDRRTKTPLPTEPELDAETDALVAEIEALAGAPTNDTKASVAELFDAVYAAPSDDGPRLVLGDLLVAQGDPRGELIQVQSALLQNRGAKGKLNARLKSLLGAYGRKWLDGLDAVVDDAEFHLGFAREVTLHRPIDPSLRAWRTVKAIRWATLAELAPVESLLHANLRGVTRLHGAPTRTVAHFFARCGSRAFEVIEARGALEPFESCEAEIDRLAVRGGAATRTEATFRALPVREVLEWFARTRLRGRVRTLDVDAFDAHALADAIAAMRADATLASIWLRPTELAAFVGPSVLRPRHWELRVSRDERGDPSVVDATWHGTAFRDARGQPPLASELAALDDDALTRFSFHEEAELTDRARADLHASIARALAKQRKLSSRPEPASS